MKTICDITQWLFENIFFLLHDFLRGLELKTWFGANLINGIFMAICAYYMVYWIKQLNLHKENGEEFQDTSAHSFLTK